RYGSPRHLPSFPTRRSSDLFVGVTVTTLVADPAIAIGLAVALAILVMSLTRSLHPPGGAAALTAVIGGAAVTRAGFWFPLVPIRSEEHTSELQSRENLVCRL